MKSLLERFAGIAGSFYDWASGWASGLLQLRRLPQLSSWLSRRWSKPPALVGIESFVALSLVMCYFFLMLPMAEAPRYYDRDCHNRAFFTEYSHHPFVRSDFTKDYPDLKTRLPGLILTGQLTDMVFDYTDAKNSDSLACSVGIGIRRYALFACVFAAYHASWLLLLFGLLIRYRADALLIILGTFAGLMLNVATPSYQMFLPWDLPSLLFFTWAILTYDNSKSILPIMVVVWLGALFKETTLCCALLILLGEHWPRKKRFVGFAVTVLAFAVTKKLLLLAYNIPVQFFSADNFFSGLRLPYNFQVTFSDPVLNHIIFVNAGTLLIMMILPSRTYREILFKILAGVFATGILLFGIIIEVRVWYEILPLGWILVSEAIQRRYRTVPDAKTAPVLQNEPSQRVIKGSYWMLMSGLLLVLIGVLVAADLMPTTPPQNNSSSQPVLEVDPDSIAANNLAWTLATSPEATDRDGTLAVKLAVRACERTLYQKTVMIGTLAAAYAEAGRFEEAISTAQKACASASELKELDLLAKNQKLLELYLKHQPYREAPAKPSDPLYR